MDKNFSPIKQRLLYFIDFIKIKKELFYQKTDISPSNFKGNGAKSEIGGEKIVNILTAFPEINPDWLITGKGEMLKSEQKPEPKSESTGMVREQAVSKKDGCQLCAAKDIRIADLEKTIRLLEKLIASLEREIDHCKKP